MFVDTSWLHNSTPQLQPHNTCLLATGAALRPKPQNLDLQGGQLLNFCLAVFHLWSGGPLERLVHLKPYPHLKNTIRIFLCCGPQVPQRRIRKGFGPLACFSFETKTLSQPGQHVSCWHFRNAQEELGG